jgi:hypothetical protein
METCNEDLSGWDPRVLQRAPRVTFYASEKAITAYYLLLHLLVCVCREEEGFQQVATRRINTLQSDSGRTKEAVPDLGEFIVTTALVHLLNRAEEDIPTWPKISEALLDEAIMRNVRWVLKDVQELEILEDGPSDYRIAIIFARSRVSSRTIMFQVAFQENFLEQYKKIGVEARVGRYGLPEEGLAEQMVEIKQIYRVGTWVGFFERVKYENNGMEEFGRDETSR